MADALYNSVYNPDVLSCLANLSNDEVLTPPDVANQMLDLLPKELWQDPNAKFLDPACKSGVFLREIAKRLIEGLKDKIPDLQTRLDHIFHQQLFAIAITEMTSLLSRRSVYCTKYPNTIYSVSKFDDPSGNIRFKDCSHVFQRGKCVFCGASEETFGDKSRSGLEKHAYEFIHTTKPEAIFGMKFDVIIGNPPYQIDDGGAKASASPIYQYFVENCKKLKPRYLIMIIPARWYGGGKGLDSFRNSMITDRHNRVLTDFLNAADCFPGVEIKGGVCYFLWNRDQEGPCQVFTYKDKVLFEKSCRYLKEGTSDVFVRFEKGVDILKKVWKLKEKTMDALVSAQKPFGLRTFVQGSESPSNGSVVLYQNGGIGYIFRKDVTKHADWIDLPKVLISAAYNAGDNYPHQILGKPIVSMPGSCCTETYEVIGPLSSVKEAQNLCTYISTKFFRFLVMLKKTSQHAAPNVFSFVPIQDFSKPWADKELYSKYQLSTDEISFIEQMIRPMDLGADANDQ
jgi:site-specific DNA-methyltransferase (adenine-specific)